MCKSPDAAARLVGRTAVWQSEWLTLTLGSALENPNSIPFCRDRKFSEVRYEIGEWNLFISNVRAKNEDSFHWICQMFDLSTSNVREISDLGKKLKQDKTREMRTHRTIPTNFAIHAHTRTLSLSLPHTCFPSLSLSLSLTHTHTHAHTHSHIQCTLCCVAVAGHQSSIRVGGWGDGRGLYRRG